LKNIARSSVAALALVALFGLTACGGGDKPAAQPSPSQTQNQDTANKPEGWTSKLDASIGFPAGWNESAGWKASIDRNSLVSIGDYLAYLDNSKNKVFVVDAKGDKKFTTNDENQFDGTPSTSVSVVHKDGKAFLVTIQYGTSKVDPSSVKKAGEESMIHVFSTDMKEAWSKSLPNKVTASNDALVVSGTSGESTITTLDVETGDAKLLNPPAGYDWAGRFSGVDVYALQKITDTGELTNGVWKYKAESSMGSGTTMPVAFGSVISVVRVSKTNVPKSCDLIDPSTGTTLDLGANSGACLSARFSSPDGNYVYFEADHSKGVISLSGKQVFTITDDISFVPTAISNDGIVYGTSGSSVAVFDFKKDTEPKKMQDASSTPIMVASNGIAVSESGYFAIKK